MTVWKGDSMERYDYRKAVKEDILDYIRDEGLTFEGKEDFIDRMSDIAWECDCITGNASGS